MKTPIVVSLLAFCVLGATMTPVAAQQAIGPVCLQIVEFAEVVEFFALPTGGGQMILTGKSLTYSDAYSGSGYVDDINVFFTFSSGSLPGLLAGVLIKNSGDGIGSVTYADNNQVQLLSFKTFAPPCVLK
jgi:hypothetical protein